MIENVLRAYFVWPTFPSISITGSACALDCLHCDKVYLKHMNPVNDPDALVQMCKTFQSKGARGVLLSGGCDRQGGLLGLDKMLPAIKRVHEMGLIIKLHTGMVASKARADDIVASGADLASHEFVGDVDTTHEIFGLDMGPEAYADTFRLLSEAGMPHITPHICVGLHYGKLKGEFKALQLLKEVAYPSTIAIIVFRPTKGTKLEDAHAPSAEDVGKVVAEAKRLFPDSKTILGAMRPRSSTRNDPNKDVRYAIEDAAFDAGIDGIEVPSQHILKRAANEGLKIKRIEAYGVLPLDYEDRVVTEWM